MLRGRAAWPGPAHARALNDVQSPGLPLSAHTKLSAKDLVALAAISAGLLAIYTPGLGSPLLFDDAQFTEGRLFEIYANLRMQVRMLSYGSFVWVRELAGDGWWKQRLANLAIHAAVVVALWALYREILRHIAPWPADRDIVQGQPADSYENSPALWIAIGFFALNPAAVYAVAYLIQRSILLATFFVVTGLWLFARGLSSGKMALLLLAVACYALAVMSKEHAILAPLAAVPVYIVVSRPGVRRLVAVAVVGSVLAGAAGFILWLRYGEILGKPFDEFSHIYLDQLSRLAPDAAANAWPLSILNQAWLFFGYGLRWMLPLPEFMSINMRPPFPVSFLTFPHLLGAVGYPAVLAGGFALVIRYRDWRALLGLSLLVPALLFGTEFATVWVQDPFVIYRSYLWAIGIPGVVFFLAHGLSLRSTIAVGVVAGSVLGWWSLDRVLSLSTPVGAYSDAIGKLPDDPRAVGRWFPYLNRGNAYFEREQLQLAARDFEASSSLGDMGMGRFNIGAIHLGAGKPRLALAAFDQAEREGYRLYNLPFQRGMAWLALGNGAEAYTQFEACLALNPPSPTREIALLSAGRAALQARKPRESVRRLEELLQAEPGHKEGRYLLGMALVGIDEYERAIAVLDKLLAEDDTSSAHLARALAWYGLKRKANAMADIEAAIKIGPDTAILRDWQAKIRAMP